MAMPSDISIPGCHRKCVSEFSVDTTRIKEVDKHKMSMGDSDGWPGGMALMTDADSVGLEVAPYGQSSHSILFQLEPVLSNSVKPYLLQYWYISDFLRR